MPAALIDQSRQPAGLPGPVSFYDDFGEARNRLVIFKSVERNPARFGYVGAGDWDRIPVIDELDQKIGDDIMKAFDSALDERGETDNTDFQTGFFLEFALTGFDERFARF